MHIQLPTPSDLNPPYKVSGQLVLTSRYMQHMHDYACIELIRNGRSIRIKNITDLTGLVNIRSKKEALSFCRLRTSPISAYPLCTGRVLYEILPRSATGQIESFGHPSLYSSFNWEPQGYCGLVEDDWFLNHKILVASVRSIGSQYIVERTCVSVPFRGHDVKFYKLTEYVGSHGEYSSAYRQIQFDGAKAIRWVISRNEQSH